MEKLWVVIAVLVSLMGTLVSAQSSPVSAKPKNMTKGQVAKPLALAPSSRPAFLSSTIRKPATLDPNSAVEVRGQARTLSMMLVLKNGKDSINFIKVRKDYRPEILATDY